MPDCRKTPLTITAVRIRFIQRGRESHRISGSSSSSSSFRFSSRSCLWLSLSSRRVDEVRRRNSSNACYVLGGIVLIFDSMFAEYCLLEFYFVWRQVYVCVSNLWNLKQKIRVVLTAHGVSVEAGRTFYRSGCVIIILRPPSLGKFDSIHKHLIFVSFVFNKIYTS